MTTFEAFDSVLVRHTLSAVWLFVDAFSGRPVDSALTVEVPLIPPFPLMPPVPWRAVPSDDQTYRFVLNRRTMAPTGALTVTAGAIDGRYVAFEPLSMTLPRPLVAHPPTPDRSDFLIRTSLWPTRLFHVQPGETGVLGSITSAGALPSTAGLRVTIWPSKYATPPAGTPYTYTDQNGDFVYRLLRPNFRGAASGSLVLDTVDISIEIRTPPAFTTTVTLTGPTFPLTLPLGQSTTLPILVP